MLGKVPDELDVPEAVEVLNACIKFEEPPSTRSGDAALEVHAKQYHPGVRSPVAEKAFNPVLATIDDPAFGPE